MKKLERSLSLSAVVAIGIGGMLGGIFVLPGIAAAKTGASVWLAYLLAALCVFPATLSKAELATAMPTSGGTYVYIERAFGPLFGTISGIGLWIALLLKSAFALVGFGAYFLILVSFPLKPTALVFLFLVMILNILGAKKAGKVQTVIVALSVIGLGVLMLWGLPQVDSSNLEPFLSDGSSGLLAATAFLFVSYAGVTKIAAIAEEIKNPNRNLPIAIMLALGGATVIYVGISFVLVGNLPIEPLKTDITPLHTLAEHLGGYTFGIAVAIIGVGSLFSMVNAGILAAPRFLFAMSRDKLLPPALSKVHPKYLTPVFTIVFTCVIIGAVIIFLDVEKIAKLASAFKVAMFMAVHACVIVLRETGVQWYDPPYRSPLYPFTQIFGILSGLGLLIVLGLTPAVILITMFGLGAGIYWVYGRKAQRSGVLSQYGQRSAQYLLQNNNSDSSSTGEITIKAAPKNLDGALSTTAKVVVPLFSKEKSPEILVEMGAALLESNKLQVVRLSEVPDQTMLDSMLDNAPVVQSLERRISAMADDHQLDVDFDAAVTHELVETVHVIGNRISCEWMVMDWDGRSGEGIFVRNPIGWLVTHLKCNFALFKDKGVRYFRKIVVCLHPTRHDPVLLATADQIAQFYGAELTLMRVIWKGTKDEERQRVEADSNQLIAACKVPANVLIVESTTPVKTIAEASASYDLLITGTPKEASFKQVLFGSGKDQITETAACSVLRITMNLTNEISENGITKVVPITKKEAMAAD